MLLKVVAPVLILLAPLHSRAATDTIVVMPFENLSGRSEYNWVGESFPASLSELLDHPGLIAIMPDERNVAYRLEGLPPTAILTRATMIKIAERAGATLVVLGTYRVAGEGRESTITVTARVIDIREGRLVGREFDRGGPLLDLQRLQGELAYEILYQRNPALPMSRDQMVTRATSAPIGAFENYIKGTLTRDRDARLRFFERAIREHQEKSGEPYFAAIFEQGRMRYEDGEHALAIEDLGRIDESNPRFDEAQFYIGVSLDALGRSDGAIQSQRELAARLPLYEVYNNIGVMLLKERQFSEAIEHLKPSSDAAPRDTDTLFNLGYAYYLAGEHAKAVETLRLELERRPSDGEAHYVLGKALEASGDRVGAIEAADQAKKLLSTYARWETRGAPLLGRMKLTFSKANYYRYKREQDERVGSRGALGGTTPQIDDLLQSARAAFLEGRNEEAIVLLGNLLQAAPQNYEAHFLLARVHERRGDFDRASNALKAALFWNPRLVPAHILIGRISVLREDCTAARASSARALQLDPGNVEALALARLISERCGS